MTDSPDPDLSAAPSTEDSLDALLGTAVRTPREPTPMVPGDELLGRFRIERLVGVGGMGAVYLAYDPTLERQVAVKLHHGASTSRLHREAVAMARLAHPNVIPVFEVGELDGQAFVVMEYVPGATLRAWHAAAPRTPHEVVAMLLAAGAGLAAAHDAGLVHRDFKPENVLVADGRARVGDFGLARDAQSREDAGAVVGTPAYMAPEQLAGSEVDARADQFAFCVTAWELLHGERPFDHATVDAIAAGPRKPARGAKVRRVLERGLAVEPAARYPDMHALLAALRRANRSRLPLALGGVALVAAAATTFAVVGRDDAPSCDDAGAEVATALPSGLPARVLAIGGQLAADGSVRIERSIKGFEDSYRRVAQRACKAAQIDHALSPELYERSRACLTIRLRTSAEMLGSQLGSPADVADSVNLAAHLPGLAGCLDAATLAASPPLPTDPARFAAVVEARASLDAASYQIDLGRTAQARATATRAAASPAAREPTVAPRLALLRGQLAVADDRLADADVAFRDAYYAARAIDDVEVALNAIAMLINTTGMIREDHAAADNWIRTGLADAEREQTRAPEIAVVLYTGASMVRLLEDRVEEATALAQRAVDLAGTSPPLVLVDALSALSDAQCTAGKYDDCRKIQIRAIGIARDLLGPRHPAIARLLADAALGLRASYHADALAMATEAKSIIDGSRDVSSMSVATTEVVLASMILNGDSTDQQQADACEMLDDARKRKVAALGEHHPDIAQIDTDLSICDGIAGDQAHAVVRLHSALAIQEATVGADSTRVADTLFNLAATLRDLKQYDEALADARRAATINAAHRPGSDEATASVLMTAAIENLRGDHAAALVDVRAGLALPAATPPQFLRGWAEMELGRALAPTDPTHARIALQEARKIFVAIGSERVPEVDAVLAKLPR